MALILTAFGQTSAAYESVVNSNEKYLFLLQSSTNLAMLLHKEGAMCKLFFLDKFLSLFITVDVESFPIIICTFISCLIFVRLLFVCLLVCFHSLLFYVLFFRPSSNCVHHNSHNFSAW